MLAVCRPSVGGKPAYQATNITRVDGGGYDPHSGATGADTHGSGGAETGNGGGQTGSARAAPGRLLTGIAALALAGMMLALLASCGSAHRRGSATAQSVSRTPSYAKPRVYVV